MQKTLAELAELLQAELNGNPNHVITGVATLQQAKSDDLTFFHNQKYRSQLESTQAGVVIISKEMAAHCPGAVLIVNDPYYAYAKAATLFCYHSPITSGIHASAIIGKNCHIDPTASIGPYVVIEDHVRVGAQTVIGAHSFIGEACEIGANCKIDPRVTLYHHVKLGNEITLASGVVLGAEGFGNAFFQGAWHKVPQLGTVVIEDNVEIGANTTIDRGALDNTLIRTGARLDNQIQIGHNVEIGAHTAMAAFSGVAGSGKIGSYCMIGGAACINGHIEIADQVMITGMAMITNSIKEKGIYSSGTGFMENREWKKNVVRFRQLDKMARRVQDIESKLKKGE